MQLRRYCQIGTLYHLLEMSALRSHTRAMTSTPLFDCVVDHALVQAFPFLNDALSQLVHILDFPAVKIAGLDIDGRVKKRGWTLQDWTMADQTLTDGCL